MHKMVYPENFESKIKFDKIRQFVQKNCLSDMGRDLVEAMKFSTEPTEIRERLEETQEFKQSLLPYQTPRAQKQQSVIEF